MDPRLDGGQPKRPRLEATLEEATAAEEELREEEGGPADWGDVQRLLSPSFSSYILEDWALVGPESVVFRARRGAESEAHESMKPSAERGN